MNKIAQCPACLKQFNQSDRAPMTLESGEVICLKCIHSFQALSNFICPIEGPKPAMTKALLKCKAILGCLPKPTARAPELTQGNSEAFYCKAHPNSPIQFFCETDETVLCSHCKSAHSKSNHSTTAFTPKKPILIDELDGIAKSIEEEVKCVSRQSSLLTLLKENLNRHRNEQLKLLNAATEKLMHNIFKQKLLTQTQLNAYYNRRIEEVESLIESNAQIEGDLNQFISQSKEIKARIASTEEKMIYSDIVTDKKEMITEWEHSRIGFRNIKMASSKIQNDKVKRVKVIAQSSQAIFELIGQEVHLLSPHEVIIPKENLRRCSESIASVKITTDSTKEELENKKGNKAKRVSNPNVHPNLLKIIPQLRQSQSQRVIG